MVITRVGTHGILEVYQRFIQSSICLVDIYYSGRSRISLKGGGPVLRTEGPSGIFFLKSLQKNIKWAPEGGAPPGSAPVLYHVCTLGRDMSHSYHIIGHGCRFTIQMQWNFQSGQPPWTDSFLEVPNLQIGLYSTPISGPPVDVNIIAVNLRGVSL